MKHVALVLTLAIAGCAARPDGYPSLAHRAVEDGSFDEPVRPAAVLAPDPVLDRRVAELSASLTAAAAAFDAALPSADTRAAAARGKPAGSDAWIDAQQALATLDDSRARVAALATDVDTAAGERAATLQPAYPALDALATRVDAELTRERSASARLQAMLAPS